MKKIILTAISMFVLLLAVGVVSASVSTINFEGSLGVITDSDASSGLWYLRQVGNPAPIGYSHAYQWDAPAVICDPNNNPVVFTGTIDVGTMVVGDVSLIGLIDKGLLEAGKTGYQSGAYVYIYKNGATTIRIGPSDGNLGGEIVSKFKDYTIPEDGIVEIELTISEGQIIVSVNGDTSIEDVYGVKKGTFEYAWDEFEFEAVPGWDNYPTTNTMPFDFEVSGCYADSESPIVPEFGAIVAMLTALGALGVFFVIRRR
jgi:hypothetical protein